MLHERVKTPKISTMQMISLLVLARLFILLIFIPQTHYTAGGTSALVAIVIGYFLTILAVLPVYFVMKKHPGMDLCEIARQTSPALGTVSAAAFYLVCMAVAIETVTQFTMFLTTTIYPRASSVWVTVICCVSVVYMILLGLEAVVRTSGIMLVLTLAASLLIGVGLVKFGDTLNLYSPFYEGVGNVLYASVLYFTQNIELVAFVLLASNLNTTDLKKTFFGYHTITNIILWLVAFSAIIVLGNYGETRNFPIYTLFALSGSNVFFRYDYILVVIWVGSSMIRAAAYLILASRMLNRLTGWRFSWQIPVLNGIIVGVVSIVSADNIKIFREIYRSIASGLPVYLLVVLLPFVILCMQWRKERRSGAQKSFLEGGGRP